jgi:hypothetical protein
MKRKGKDENTETERKEKIKSARDTVVQIFNFSFRFPGTIAASR